MILFIFVMNSSHRVWTEIAEYFADRKVSMEAVKGMMGLAKFKSDVISWNGRIVSFILDTNLSASFKHF